MKPSLEKLFWKERFNFNMSTADRISLTMVVLSGIFISVITAYFVSQSEFKARQLELENLSNIYLSKVMSTLKSNVNTLYNIQGFYNASVFIDANEFNIFTDPVLSAYEEIKVLEWVPVVEHKNRVVHERAGQDYGYINYEISDMALDGIMLRADKRDVYYPVFYANPVAGNEQSLGLDYFTSDIRRQAMEKSRDTGFPVATELLDINIAGEEHPGFLIFLAVYDRADNFIGIQQRRDQLTGFILAIYQVKDLFMHTVEKVRDVNLAVSVNDVTDNDISVNLFATSSFQEKSLIKHGKNRLRSNSFNIYTKEVKFAGRRWKFYFHLLDTSDPLFNLKSTLVLSTGFIFTAFIAAYILGNSRRRSVVELLIKQRTQELETVKNEIQQVLDNTGEGICGIDVYGNTTFVNTAALEITGFKEEEFLYAHQHRLIHHHHADGSEYAEEDCCIYSAFTKGKVTVDNEVFWHKNGQAIPVEYTATPMLDKNSKVRGAVIVFRDISERKKYEAEIITERNHAEQASQAKSTFLATMSHEIRTPMNGMLGMAQLLANTQLNPKQKDYVDTLIQSGQALLNQINDILDFSRIEAGKLDIEVAAFNLEKCCSEVIQLMKNRADEKGLNLNLIYPDNYPKIALGDKHRVQQILLNLVGNAIKFTPQGYIDLNVIYNSSDVNANFSFQVIDSGIGIEKEKQEQLFQSFTQADASTTRKYGGSGLGLAISKRLARLMGGDILLDSTPGEGTTLTLKIKLKLASEVELKNVFQAAEKLVFKGRVLLVEDNFVNQKVAGAMLQNMGLEVHIADNGESALQEINKNDFDLVLMDCQMPVIDGYAATKQIRLLDKGKKLPVLALTANVLPENIQLCHDAGMDECLHKPIEMPVLQQALKKWLPYEYYESENDMSDSNETDEAGGAESYVDAGHLNNLAEIMGEVFVELIPAFISATDEFFNDIESLLDNQDLITAERFAHSLKSSSRNVGAMLLGDLAEEIENGLKENNTGKLDELLKNAESVYQKVRQELLDFEPANGQGG